MTPFERRIPPVTRRNFDRGASYMHTYHAYRKMTYQPLKISGQMLSPMVIQSDAIHLDAVLAYAVSQDVDARSITSEGTSIPLPLAQLWCSDDGWPVWASTSITPLIDGASKAPEYIHKRYPDDRTAYAAKVNADPKAGRWKEYRIPIATMAMEKIEAHCIGNLDAVKHLLTHITHVGKKAAMGFGRVIWTIEPWDILRGDAEGIIVKNRPLPAAMFANLPTPEGMRYRPLAGWHAPYWDASCWGPCFESMR